MDSDPPATEGEGNAKPKKPKKRKSDKPSAGKCRKIRLYPTDEQKRTLMKWFGVARLTYNLCVEALKNKTAVATKKSLRQKFVKNENFKEDRPWVLDVPWDVRDEAANDLVKAVSAQYAKAALAKTDEERAKVLGSTYKFRSRKNKHQTIRLLAQKYGTGIYKSIWGKDAIRASEPLPDVMLYDCTLTRDWLGRFYLAVPRPLETRGENQAPISSADGVAALDPGNRTFQTVYSTNEIVEWGKGDQGRLVRLCHHLDQLHSRIDKASTHRRRYRLRRASRRASQRIRNVVDELHKKCAKWLCENYRVILIPKFESSKMVLRAARKINKKSVRMMLTWSHYRFRQRLINKAREYPWCKVITCLEPYTTRTCGRCGFVRGSFSDKEFKCPSCHCVLDRDGNGARNVLLRYLSLYCPIVH